MTHTRSTKTRCKFSGCDDMAVYAGIRCPQHRPQPPPEPPGPEPRWYCELCERMHAIGHHDPGVSWPQQEAAPQPQPRSGQPAGPALRCLCGISLWATEETAKPNVWARHVAHTEAWRADIQQAFDQAVRERDEIRVCLGTDVWVSWLPGDWHEQP